MYFKKIKLDFPNINFEDEKLNMLVSYRELCYFRIKKEARNKIVSILPNPLQSVCGVTFVNTKVTLGILPHTDNDIKVGINHYLETADAVTTFYEPKIGGSFSKMSMIDSDSLEITTGKVYNHDELIINDQFKAEPGETYILNSSKIHSVTKIKLPKIRKFIQISFSNTTYEEVAELFI